MILTQLKFAVATVLSAATGDVTLGAIEQEYAAYLRLHGKSPDRLHDVSRLERFRYYRNVILDHNLESQLGGTSKHSFSLKMNSMADMLPDEVDQLFGYRNHKKESRKHQSQPKHSLRAKVHSQAQEKSENYYHSNLYPFFGQKKHKMNEGPASKLKAAPLPESLNWASGDNPIGDSVMSAVRNQGGCSACWAFVAVATTEAALRIALSEKASTNLATHHMQGAETQIVQTAGYGLLQSRVNGSLDSVRHSTKPPFDIADDQDLFPVSLSTNTHSNSDTDINIYNSSDTSSDSLTSDASSVIERPPFDIADDQDMFPLTTTTFTTTTTLSKPSISLPNTTHSTLASAISSDQRLTADFAAPRMAWIPSLSVQELVDCDTSFNRGCSGGSPLYAFRFIAENGLLPWSRYEYEEKVDVCSITKASVLPVAKYFLREYGKVGMLDSAALMAALTRGPVALGVCGTDPRFMLYSTGVFDLDSCCTDQNHAITLVGYGHDEVTGLDYWYAQNSWGKMWGESGYIKIKRTELVGQAGICGMLANPMYGTGGYILDEKGHFIDPTTSPHYPRYVTDMQHWVEDNWREMMLITSAILLCLSLLILLYACYIERLMYLRSQLRAARLGYTAVPDANWW